ncbi:hypothetical protein PAPHI01_0805 [Pancytospora philotis]|nr:hypothetical protein PAPHI01_0805 [Pancytospora philotis]
MRRALYANFAVSLAHLPLQLRCMIDRTVHTGPISDMHCSQQAKYSNLIADNVCSEESLAEEVAEPLWEHDFLSILHAKHSTAIAKLSWIRDSISEFTLLPLARFFEQVASGDLPPEHTALENAWGAEYRPERGWQYDRGFFGELYSPKCSELTAAYKSFCNKYAAHFEHLRDSVAAMAPARFELPARVTDAYLEACKFVCLGLLLDAELAGPEILVQMLESYFMICGLLCHRANGYTGGWAEKCKQKLALRSHNDPHLAKSVYENFSLKVHKHNEMILGTFNNKIEEMRTAMAEIEYLNGVLSGLPLVSSD